MCTGSWLGQGSEDDFLQIDFLVSRRRTVPTPWFPMLFRLPYTALENILATRSGVGNIRRAIPQLNTPTSNSRCGSCETTIMAWRSAVHDQEVHWEPTRRSSGTGSGQKCVSVIRMN